MPVVNTFLLWISRNLEILRDNSETRGHNQSKFEDQADKFPVPLPRRTKICKSFGAKAGQRGAEHDSEMLLGAPSRALRAWHGLVQKEAEKLANFWQTEAAARTSKARS